MKESENKKFLNYGTDKETEIVPKNEQIRKRYSADGMLYKI